MSASRYWTIDEDHVVHGPYAFEGWIEWAKNIENLVEFEKVCRVGRTQIDGDCWVSTVFLRGIDHGLYYLQPDAPPSLFETMVFGGAYDTLEERYSTWEQAAAGHQRAVDLVMGRIEDNKKAPAHAVRVTTRPGPGGSGGLVELLLTVLVLVAISLLIGWLQEGD